MIHYRTFRNTDAPHLLTIWNEAFPGRSAYTLRSTTPFERWLFSKPYFDPEGLILAEADGIPIGFVHAGFGPNADQTALDHTVGVVCMIAVRLAYQRQKIGSELMRRAEDYLRTRGSVEWEVGACAPRNPFYFGLYGGSNSPGFLESDSAVHPFLRSLGFQVVRRVAVFQRRLNRATSTIDGRFFNLKRQFDATLTANSKPVSWWQASILGMMEPYRYELIDRATGETAATAMYWEMEGFPTRWGLPAAGIMDIHVPAERRKHGLAKFLLVNLLRHVQDQHFQLAKMQVPDDNAEALGLFTSLAFQQVDTGLCYARR